MVNKVKLGELLTLLTDYHANGAYEKLKENVELCDDPDYAVMIRTTNFEQNNFDSQLKFINEHAYNFLKKSKVYAGDIIMNKIANAGSSYLMPELNKPVSLAMNLFLLRIDPLKANPVYVYLYLKLNEAYVKSFANGSVTKTITKDAVRNLDIELPDKFIQDEVVNTYFRFTDKIDVNNKNTLTLEQMAQVLFKSWFMDFDQVIDNALDAGNTIPDDLQHRIEHRKQAQKLEDYKRLPDNIRNLFPNEFEESELGWIPKGWQVSTIGNHIDFKNGYAFKSKELTGESNDSFPIFKMGHIKRGGGFKSDGTKSYIEKSLVTEKQSRNFAKKGDLLMAMTDMKSNMAILGNTALMPENDVFLVNQRVGRLIVNAKTFLNYPYLYFYTNDKLVVEELRSRANSGVQVNLTTASIKETLLLVPSEPVHKLYDVQVKDILEKTFHNDKESKELSKLRDILLPQLISGGLQLTEAEKQ